MYFQTKCESYLPEVSARFGDIEVTTNSISERNGYILRNLTLKVSQHKPTSALVGVNVMAHL